MLLINILVKVKVNYKLFRYINQTTLSVIKVYMIVIEFNEIYTQETETNKKKKRNTKLCT